LIQHLFDLFSIDGFYFLLVHLNLHILPFLFQLPGTTSSDETVFTPNEETVQEEKEHVSQFSKRDGDEHHFSREDMEKENGLII
jgi:hypothetical protein